jgi:6-phosphogluconolactonase
MRWILSLLCVFVAAGVSGADDKDGKYWVFVGTYTGGKSGSKGIYRFELDLATGKLTNRELAAEVEQPSFLALHPRNLFLYSVGEYGKLGAKKTGAVNSFALDAKTGALKPLNLQSSGGDGPCHLVVDRAGKHVLAANYGGGSVCVLPIQKDGRLGEMTDFVQHQGKSVVPGRQDGPHAHSINVDFANKFAFAADLGLDKVLTYRFDPSHGILTKNNPPDVDLPAGSGPRHFAFHPNGQFAYVINELTQTVTAMTCDADKGSLKSFQTISTVPMPVKGNSTAEVVVHPSGKFLYGSNRGHNSIAIFTIDEKTGQLTSAGWQTKGIKTPRNFAIDPTGKYLIAANQDSDSLVVFQIDAQTGQLGETGVTVEVPRPVCVRFVPVAK